MSNVLINQAAHRFAIAVDDMIGAPIVELHDVMDPNPLLDAAARETAEELQVTLVDRGEPWYALLTRIADRYEEVYVS